jgi:uroporphyrin-III C-methyltransferase/precorrin-2 dehydrogenase/sirohydrochlorin ferrochelatase
MNLYPLGLRLKGRKVLVVGGGGVAGRRVPALLAAGADVHLVSPEAGPGLEGLAEAGRIRWERRGFRPSDVDGSWLVLAATSDRTVNEAVSAEAETRRIFCVRADDASAATAWTPAVTRHERLTVAVFAGGDPRRSAGLRDAIAERFADGSLDAAHHRDPRPDRPGRLRPAAARPVPGVALVGAGPGDPELITVRGRRLLSRADVVIADRLAPQLLLDELPGHVELIDAAKLPYGRAVAQQEINRLLVERALAGRYVVRLKGGDSFLFGRGGEELLACLAEGIPVEVVPGVTSALAVPAVVGIPVTHRGVAHELVVVSGHIPPDHPDSLVDWVALGRLTGTLVLLMGVENLPAISHALLDAGRPADSPAAAIQEGTTAHQKVVRATLGDIAEVVAAAGIRPPAVIVIGEVARFVRPRHVERSESPP